MVYNSYTSGIQLMYYLYKKNKGGCNDDENYFFYVSQLYIVQKSEKMADDEFS
ncbi:hypothetical protein BSG1_07504 [Bacillus sp. SG-1]|nr:hypothetical protein BSG1_07504 [Bacillus sp. SG-1]